MTCGCDNQNAGQYQKLESRMPEALARLDGLIERVHAEGSCGPRLSGIGYSWSAFFGKGMAGTAQCAGEWRHFVWDYRVESWIERPRLSGS